MPRGRVPVHGGYAWGRLSFKIGIRTLERFRDNKAPNLTWREAYTEHRRVRQAVNFYRVCHGGNADASSDRGPQTRTAIIKVTKAVVTSAARVAKNPDSQNWRDRLDDALSVEPLLLANLHYAMRRKNITIWSLRRKLQLGDFSENDMRALDALSQVDPQSIVPRSDHPDPSLKRLVFELMPVWTMVTGTSPYPKTVRNEERSVRYGDKTCPFADWVDDLIQAAGLRPPAASTTARLVRLQESRK